MTLNETALTLEIGQTGKLMASIAPVDATDKSIEWKSSNEKVATVDENGQITALAEGTATITATAKDGNLAASCTVTVIKQTVVSAPEEKISVDPAEQRGLTKDGEIITISADTTYANAAVYTGKKIDPSLALKAKSTVNTAILTQVEKSYQGFITVSYVSKNNKDAYVDGEEGYNAKKRPYFYAKLKFSNKDAKAAGLSKQEIAAIKKTVSQLNKKLKNEKYYYNINPQVLTDSNAQIKATLNKKTGQLKLNKNGQLTGIKFIKYKDDSGSWKKLTKKDYEIISVDAEKKTVVLQGKGNMTGRVTLNVMTQ